MRFILHLSVLVLLVSAGQSSASYLDHPEATKFIDEMVQNHQLDRDKLKSIFTEATKKQSILDAISRPAEKRLEWKGYRKIFLTEDRISKGIQFMQKHKAVLARAEKEFGVPAEIITAIIGVETRYGGNKGSYRVIDALSTLAFDYPPRGKFFRKELEQVFLLSKEQGFDELELVGSYAGAMGYGQFIPSSYRHYAVDFDGDNVADILNNPVDAIGSVANYFAKHKWKSGEPIAFRTALSEKKQSIIHDKLKPSHKLAELKKAGVQVSEPYDLDQLAKLQVLNGSEGEEHWVTLHNFYVITRYNHSHLYAMAVFQLSNELKAGL